MKVSAYIKKIKVNVMAIKIGIGTNLRLSGGVNWSSYWATLISAVVNDTDATKIDLTFPSAKSLDETDFTIPGVTWASSSWAGAVLTLVATAPIYTSPTITFVTTGGTAFVKNPRFIITVDTTKAGSASDTFILPTDGSSTYDYYVDWGDGGAEAHVTAKTSQTKVYASSGTYQIKIRGTFPHIYFNNAGDKLKLISIDNWGDIAWGSFLGAFYGCSNMNCTASDSADISEVTSFYFTFYGCSSLTSLDTSGWDTAKVETFQSAFYNCSSLTYLDTSGWNTAKVTTFAYTFLGCSLLASLDTSGWNTAKVTTFTYTFYGCSSLTSLDTSGWDTAKVTTFFHTFYNCSNLKGDFSLLKLTVATDVSNMFGGCNINTTGTTTNYDKLLVAWATADVPNSLNFNGGTSKYSVAGGGTAARASLGTDDLWIIADGGQL